MAKGRVQRRAHRREAAVKDGSTGSTFQYDSSSAIPDPPTRLVAVSPTSNIVAVALDTAVKVFCRDSTPPGLATLTDDSSEGSHTATIRALAFNRTGRLLLTAGDDKHCKVWDTATWACIVTHTTPKKISAACFSADSEHVIFADKYGEVYCGRAAAQPLPPPAGETAGVTASGEDAAAEPPTSGPPPPNSLFGHFNSIVTSLDTTPAAPYLLSSDRDNRIRVNIMPQHPTQGIGTDIQSYCLGHTQFVTDASFCQAGSSDRLWLLSGAGDGTVRCWSPEDGAPVGCCEVSAPGEGAGDGGGEKDRDAEGTAPDQEEPGTGGASEDAPSEPFLGLPPAVVSLAAHAASGLVAAAVEGRNDITLLALQPDSGALSLLGPVELPGVMLPSRVTFDGEGRLWAAGGPATNGSSFHLGCVSVARGSAGEAPSVSPAPQFDALVSALETRSEADHEVVGAASQVSKQLKKRAGIPAHVAKARKLERRQAQAAERCET